MVSAQNELPVAWWRRSFGFALDAATASHARASLLLILVCLAAFLPGFLTIPPTDRDESRFAQASKQMIESGDYVDIRFHDEVRYKKPVGIYWMQTAAVKVGQALGVRDPLRKIWLYRIPSLLAAIGAVLLTYWAGLALASRRAALLAGLMMASSILLGVEARLAKTDAVLLLTCVAAMGAMARAYMDTGGPRTAWRSFGLPLVFWTAIGTGFLVKGPLILMVVGLAMLVLAIADRSLRWFLLLRPFLGVLWAALIVAPWFVAIMQRAGNTFVQGSVSEDLLSKIFAGAESHGAPPGTYLLLFFVTFWPGAVLAGLAVASVWRERREVATRFLLAWIIPSWIVFELVATKLPHYVLPLYPAIALLIATRVVENKLTRSAWLERGLFWWLAVPLILGVGAFVAVRWIGGMPGIFAIAFLVPAVALAFLAWWFYPDDGAESATLRAVAASVLLSAALYGGVIAAAPNLFPSFQAARIIRAQNCELGNVAAAGFHEASLVFLTGAPIRLIDAPTAADFLQQPGGCRLVLIEARQERAFAQRAQELNLRYERVARIDGFAIGNSRRVGLLLFRAGAAQ